MKSLYTGSISYSFSFLSFWSLFFSLGSTSSPPSSFDCVCAHRDACFVVFDVTPSHSHPLRSISRWTAPRKRRRRRPSTATMCKRNSRGVPKTARSLSKRRLSGKKTATHSLSRALLGKPDVVNIIAASYFYLVGIA